jgi:triacylglycerol lipase
MSFLVELARSAYPKNALDGFKASSHFNLDNARTMMWLSQLAYETADKTKVESILTDLQLKLRVFEGNDPVTGLPPHSACVVVAGGREATFVAFSGTDPLKIEDWITDFTPMKSLIDLHSGFQKAVGTVWPTVSAAIANRPASENRLFFTGHSLGGALAIIAAEKAMRELGAGATATAVYTFGGPRVGGEDFFGAYTPRLGNSTFRLINDTDIVPTVPPAFSGFRHVGRAQQCRTDGLFDETSFKPIDENKPDFAESALKSGLSDFRALAAFRFLRSIGPRPLDRLAGLLPRMVRDHVPTSYFRALRITV